MVRPRVTNRREQILQEASRLFATGGYDGTSIRTIATACGITEAAIYRHYKNKLDLYQEVIQAKAAQHDIPGQLAASTAGLGIEEVMTRLATYVLDLAQRDRELMQLMISNTRESDPAAAVLFREVRQPMIDHLAGEITARMASGEVRTVDPLITARCFVGMVVDCALSVGVWAILNRQSFRSSDVICNNVPIFARGLLAAPQ